MKEFISYSEYELLLKKLLALISLTGREYNYVYGIPKGGLPIAVHLAHHLDAELFVNYDLFRYEHDILRTKDFLVVDDICDTGKTLKPFVHRYDTLTMVYKPLRSPDIKPVYYAHTSENWIVFPWERTDEVPNREGYEQSDE